MRKGRQYTIFGVSPRPGLSNYLSGIDVDDPNEVDLSKYIQKTEVENLLIMTAGNIPPNPSELLVAPQMNKLLEDLKEVCDVVIIDGTPCELVTDSIILSRIVDSTVVVTAHKETKKDNLERIIRNIQNVGGHLAGVVINKMPISIKKYNENYYYASTTGSTMKSTNSNNAAKIKQKADNIIKQNSETYKETYNPKGEDLSRPDFVRNNNQDIKSSTVEKTSNILEQINSYLDQEKKNLN